MCELREFDLRSRGAACLAEDWQKNHHEVRKIWRAGDLIQTCIENAKESLSLYDDFRTKPDPEYRFAHFRSLLQFVVAAYTTLTEHVSVFEDEGYPVEGLDELRRLTAKLQEIIDEDRFAEDSSVHGGALDDWD